MNDASPEPQQDNAELEPAEALEELLEEIVETLELDASVEVEEGDGVLTGRLEGEDSACSSAATARRSTRSSTSPSGSCSPRAPLRCGS